MSPTNRLDFDTKEKNIKEEREIESEEIQLCLEDMEFCRRRRGENHRE